MRWSCVRESPTSESPGFSAWSRNVNGWCFASVKSHSDSFESCTAIGFLSTPYKHFCATTLRACSVRSSSGGTFGVSLCRAHASLSASPRKRQASTRNAPEPIAGSHTLSARISRGSGLGPRLFTIGPSVVCTIGSVSERGV